MFRLFEGENILWWNLPSRSTDEAQRLWLWRCDTSPMAAAHWRPHMWQTWAVVLFMNGFSLWWARFSWSATMWLFSNSETLAKQVWATKISLVRPSSKLSRQRCTIWGLTSERPWTVSLDGLQDAARTWAARRATLLKVGCHPCGPRGQTTV